MTEEGIHRPCRSEPDIVEDPKCPNLEPWVLELGGEGWIRLRIEEKELALVSL